MKLYPDAAKKFLEETRRFRTDESRRSFLYTISQLQRSYPSKSLAQFRASEVSAFCTGGDVAPNTIRARATRVRVLFEWAAWRDLCSADVANDLKHSVRPGNHTVKTHKWLTADEVRLVMQAFPTDEVGRRDRLVFLLGVSLGLRLNEIASLRRSSFTPDFSDLTGIGKGQKPIHMGVGQRLQKELGDWDVLRPPSSDVLIPRMRDCTTSWEDGVRIKELDWSAPLGVSGLRDAVSKAASRVGLKVRPHDLRRSFAGIMEDQNYTIQDISRALRHNDVATTSRYLERNPKRSANITRGFDLDL